MLKVVAITAGLSASSTSRMLTNMITAQIATNVDTGNTETTTQTIELKDYAVDIMHNMTNGYASPQLTTIIQQVEQADIIVAVTPIFTASMSGLFKSFFDILDNKILQGKTVIMGATGGSTRHSLVLDYAMRPMFAYLKADVVPTSIFAATEDWGGSSGIEERITQAVQEALSKTYTTTESVKNMPTATISKHDTTATMTSLPFEELLANIAGNKVTPRNNRVRVS